MAKLYIIPTPVGNLKDITLRAIDVLNDCDLILAEDTRTSSVLLKAYDIKKPMQSYHKFNEHSSLDRIIDILNSDKKVCLISDAGTPGISDPGYLIVKKCIENQIDVECLPGATSFVPALINSGLPNDRFCFEGFLPRKKGRHTRLITLGEDERTMIFFESPFRLVKTLTEFSNYFGGDRKACVCREISKLHEESARGSLDELVEHFSLKNVKGEIVIIVSGKN